MYCQEYTSELSETNDPQAYKPRKIMVLAAVPLRDSFSSGELMVSKAYEISFTRGKMSQ